MSNYISERLCMHGGISRQLLNQQSNLLNHLAALLDMATALKSKKEKGQRLFWKESLTLVASDFYQSEHELVFMRAHDKFFDTIQERAIKHIP